jgi:glutamine synthetase
VTAAALDADEIEAALAVVREAGAQRVRIAWCDLHGLLRAKTLLPEALPAALRDGVGLVGTLLLKDTSDRTAYPVFQPGGAPEGFAGAGNLLLRPDPASFRLLPWAPGTGWMLAQPAFADGRPVPQDPRRVLQQALARLAAAGYGLRCGLEVEFHVYRIVDARLDPTAAHWPPEPPEVELIHPGWQLLSEGHADQVDEVFGIVQQTALGLNLPLRSLEVELGPSQLEAVLGVQDALAAADAMVAFRHGVKQALRRAGYHASFACRPPFENVMSSGWHLHQSLERDGRNAFVDSREPLSAAGRHWLAGLLAHAAGATVFGTSTVNGFGRFRPNALAPTAIAWGRDNRGALLRVLGGAGDAGTRIENRIGEPAANPYTYIASQIHAGLDGLERRLEPPPPTESPYADDGQRLPTTLTAALDALLADAPLADAMGRDFVELFVQVKRQEQARWEAAEDKALFDRREYFSRL